MSRLLVRYALRDSKRIDEALTLLIPLPEIEVEPMTAMDLSEDAPCKARHVMNRTNRKRCVSGGQCGWVWGRWLVIEFGEARCPALADGPHRS